MRNKTKEGLCSSSMIASCFHSFEFDFAMLKFASEKGKKKHLDHDSTSSKIVVKLKFNIIVIVLLLLLLIFYYY